LGDFNVLTCLYASIDSLKGAIKHFDLSFATGIKESESINKNFAANDKSGSGTPYNSVSTNAKYQYISSFKVQYGMGARAGMEQFGLIKKYRPYIRLIGAIKDTKSNNVVWQNKIIVFGDAYLGSKAAKNVSGAELQNDFVVLCNQLAGILINDINGDSKFNGTQEMVDWLP
jgi:hypothetical protein